MKHELGPQDTEGNTTESISKVFNDRHKEALEDREKARDIFNDMIESASSWVTEIENYVAGYKQLYRENGTELEVDNKFAYEKTIPEERQLRKWITELSEAALSLSITYNCIPEEQRRQDLQQKRPKLYGDLERQAGQLGILESILSKIVNAKDLNYIDH